MDITFSKSTFRKHTSESIIMKPNVIFLGSQYWSNYLCTLFNDSQYISAYTLQNIIKWIIQPNKSICLVGIGPPNTWKRRLNYLFSDILYFIHFIKHKSIYWIGSDVTLLNNNYRQIARFSNFAGSPWLADEVNNIGYKCQCRFFPVKININANLPWPTTGKLTVLCYLPDSGHKLYGSEEILYLANFLTDIEIIVIGGVGNWCKDKPTNISFMGWVDDVNQYIAQSHIILRMTKHDSFSAFVREGLVAGRYVIFSYDIPGAIYVKSGDINQLVFKVSEINNKHKNKSLQINKIDEKTKTLLLDVDYHLKAISNEFI